MSLLELEQVTVRFGPLTVLDHFSLSVPQGSTTGIMGPSGSGKTTLLRVMMGLQRPDEGRILGFTGRRSAVFQENRLCDNLSVRTNLRLTAPHAGDALLEETLSALGLDGQLHQPVRLLSGGMQRRIALARALLADFTLLFLDEPFTGLDDAARDRSIALLRRRAEGKTVFLVTHSADTVQILADQVVTLRQC